LTQEDLDLYVLQRAPTANVVAIEEHLLVCQQCRDALDQLAVFVRGIRCRDWFSVE
jgi:predicted anti-sigma-YlaC factor YlaD